MKIFESELKPLKFCLCTPPPPLLTESNFTETLCFVKYLRMSFKIEQKQRKKKLACLVKQHACFILQKA